MATADIVNATQELRAACAQLLALKKANASPVQVGLLSLFSGGWGVIQGVGSGFRAGGFPARAI